MFAILKDYKAASKLDKMKLSRAFNAMRKFHLYHSFRRYAKQVSIYSVLQNKDRIEGAYLILRRFKDRLKGIDEVVKKVNQEKVNRTELKRFEDSMDQNRAITMFDDMKTLFDTTVL